jgi:tRNA-splicing ligase RtcB
MGARSYIVRGRGNPESFCSCAHGAGRRMSRTDKGVIDEIPGAYKDIDQVMANQADLVEVVHTLKQVVCVKG